jgi:simple sugar transport system permease protein
MSIQPEASTGPAVTLLASNYRQTLRAFVFNNRRALSALLVFVIMLTIFTAANPRVFTNIRIYTTIFLVLPVSIFLVIPLVFLVVSGEIDLAFPATMGIGGWMFALAVDGGWNPFLALGFAVLVGTGIGLLIGILVTYVGLSSLVATLGANFLLRGLINVGSEAFPIHFAEIEDSVLHTIMAAKVGSFPVQMFWAIGFVAIGWLLFNRHQFGARVQVVGDNPESAREMGINVNHLRIVCFMFVGTGAALAGVLSGLINFVWWPTTGDGFLLTALAAVFVGGTPTWGGVGTVIGSSIGVFTIVFIETGVVAAGLSGFYTRFFNGLIIILSLVGHRFNGPRER